MNVINIIQQHKGHNNFSFEVLPPLKGYGTANLFATIDRLKMLHPLYVNITTHHSEYVYRALENGQFERNRVRRRPGTIAIAAAIQNKYQLPVVPHVICSGATAEQIEYELLDLQFLGIENLLLLRGDKAKDDRVFTPVPGGYCHTTELISQVNRFNNGQFLDGTSMKYPGHLFTFVEQARAQGITLPIIPGIKPFARLSQFTVVPKTFHCDLPEALAHEVLKCKTDEDAKQLGIAWGVEQCKELYAAGVSNIHFYTVSAVESVYEITKQLV